MSRLLPRFAVIAALFIAQIAPAEPARVAIIIDDLGYDLEAGIKAIDLPGPIACAILPETPRGRELAERARQQGKEVLLHLPLQSQSHNQAIDPGAIGLDTSRERLARIFASNIESVPHAIGVNSHRGSLLTRHPGHMAWLMQEIKANGALFFVDSYTTERSIALDSASESGVPAVRRDVFLDPDRDPQTVERQFARLKELARRTGMAVGIGHPYPATLKLLERELPGLGREGIDLISISRYVSLKVPVAAD